MKILLVTPRYYPETFSITRIAEELAKRGHDLTIVTGKPNYGKWKIYDGYENVQNEVINNVKIIRLNEKPRTKGMLGLIKNYLSIHSIYKKFFLTLNEKYDIVFSHILSPLFTISKVSYYCKKYNIPHFSYGLDLWPESLIATGLSHRYSPFYQIMKSSSKKIYKTCDFIAYASPSAENYLKNYLKLNIPFKHIYQPCLTNIPNNEELTSHEYKKDGKLHILFCGTIAKFNHLNLILKAIKTCKNATNIVFDIVGSGSEMSKMQKLSKKLKLENNVIFHGRVTFEETISYFNDSDVLLVPLFYNSATSNMIPQKVIEYFMYQRPILGMIKGDGAELIKQASPLNIIARQTSDDIASAIDKLYEYNEEQFKKCGNDNRNYFSNNKRFLLETIATEIEESFNKTIEIHNKK